LRGGEEGRGCFVEVGRGGEGERVLGSGEEMEDEVR